jgi:hypothetical protein
VRFEVRSQNHGKRLLPSLCLSICPPLFLSVDMEQLDGFSWHLIFEFFFLNLSRKFKFHKILINITATVPEDVFTLLISRSVPLRMKSIGDKICCRGYQNTFYILSFRFFTLQMGPIGRTETSVRNYHYSLRNNPEKRSPSSTSRRNPEVMHYHCADFSSFLLFSLSHKSKCFPHHHVLRHSQPLPRTKAEQPSYVIVCRPYL